ncbi:MAG TPA: CHASE2 domain-containing protein [Verrucomicrobiales bacterium]|nr:CHASE2 domain-containing protein [Verrucomicrobiales bacterium]
MNAKIFISYRRDDTAIYAQALQATLCRHFPEKDIFIDVVSIKPGVDFVAAIEEAVGQCDILLALIGRQWLTITGEDGKPRLENAEDFVRVEISTALRRGVRVVPVLVQGAIVPKEEDLPEPMRPLSRCLGVELHDKRFLQEVDQLISALREALDPDTPSTVDGAVEALKRRLRFQRTSLFAAACLAVSMFLVGWVGLMDRVFFGLQTQAEMLTVRVGDLFAGKMFSDQIALVLIDEETRSQVGEPFENYAFWRRHHAQVLARLSESGAAVVAFDFFFQRDTAADEDFAEAITEAQGQGTAVLLGARAYGEGKPRIAEKLLEAASGWGALCIDRKLGYAASAPLAIVKRGENNERITIPSLALQCYIAHRGGDAGEPNAVELNFYDREVRVHLPPPPEGAGTTVFPCFDLAWPVRHTRKACPVIARGDTYAGLALDLSPLALIRNRATTYRYEDLLGEGTEPLSAFAGKVVLIGHALPQDEFEVVWRLRPQARYGVELHADALNALLHAKPIREPGFLTKLALLLGCYFLGAFIRTRLLGFRFLWRAGTLASLVLAYFLLAMYCYAQFRILLSLLDGFLAFALSFWAVGVIRRKWFS